MADNRKLNDEPHYKRQHVLPLSSAIQSKESWRWPPPERPHFSLLNRILNSTTLTTQVVTHQEILGHGSVLQAEFASDLKTKLAEVETLQKNFVKIVEEEVKKAKSQIESRYKEKMTKHLKEKQVVLNNNWEQKLVTALELEKERAQRMEAEWRLRMDDAVKLQAEQLEQDFQKRLNDTKSELELSMANDTEKRVAEALKKQLEILEGGFRDKLDKELEKAENRHKADMECLKKKLNEEHQNDTRDLRNRCSKLHERYTQLLEFSKNVERDYLLLENEYRMFIDNVKGAGGHFDSEYLLRRKQYGLLITGQPKKEDISIEKLPDFSKFQERSQSRLSTFNELSAALTELSDSKDSAANLPSQNLIPVKLVRPLDSDEFGSVVLPVHGPEESSNSFILSFSNSNL